MNGSGMKTSSASPTATVPPENSVARPAVRMVIDQRVLGVDSWLSSSSRKRKTTSIE